MNEETHTPIELAERYFDAWERGDEEGLRAVLAPHASFRGPLGSADDADGCVAGLLGMRRILERVEVRARVADDRDVITFFDLHTRVAEPAPTANWSRVEDGRITEIRVTFDPRGILAAG